MTFKIGMIGLGAIGQRLLIGFTNHKEIEVAAICDQLPERVKEVAGSLRTDVATFTNHKDMLEKMELDLVYVAVPPKYHHAVASDVIASGVAILCEKPLANSVEEAESLAKQVQSTKALNAMNFPLNYSAAALTFAKLIKDNYIGSPRRIELKLRFPKWPRSWQQNEWVASREQGGYVLEVGVHFIQQIQKIFGGVKDVVSHIQYPDDPKACEEAILATMSLEDGTPILVDGLSDIAGREEIALTVYGTEGTLILRNWGSLEGGKKGEAIEPLEVDGTFDTSLIDHLVRALKGEEATLIDFEAGLNAQILLEALRRPKN